jgi:aspartate/methionine/tyrosine aminotransferase
MTLRDTLNKHPKTKAIILCNPSNPTGGVASRKQLEAIAEVLVDFPQVIIISDEIYEQLVYDTEHVSFASLPGMFDRTVTINGFSKSHSMTGYRVGYSASATDIAKGCSKLQSQMTSCASSIGQHSANIALTQVPTTWMEERRKELLGKRDLAYNMIMSIPGVTCPKPTGAFYLLPDVSFYYGKSTTSGKKINNPDDLCLELLREHQVALVSGDAFGAPKCIRLSYAASREMIDESISRLKMFLLSLV